MGSSNSGKYRGSNSPAERQKMRTRYMDLVLYPDEFDAEWVRNHRDGRPKAVLEDEARYEREQEVEILRSRIKRFKYTSIRSFVSEMISDSMNGLLEMDVASAVVAYLRGYRDKIQYEHIRGAHCLTVNGRTSRWVDVKLPVEIGGYMAFYKGKNRCRIIRIFEVEKYQLIKEDDD